MIYRLLIFLGLFMMSCADQTPVEENKDRKKWDKKYSGDTFLYGKDPSPYLKDSLEKLTKGKALDIAAGEGRNAVFLAENGWDVDAVDISAIGLEKAKKLAAEKKCKIHAVVADLTTYKIQENTYDVIVNFYYLQRDLFPQIIAGLKEGGVVVFETFTTDHLQINSKMKREYCLEKNELKNTFAGFEIIEYEEVATSNKAVARLIARKKRKK
ncbi:class I SAM-dependent methyltransferase [Candidatus Uabimicrobium amorphum]|uniref:SAM-dependent methyltransferase n=1 Tax=Uabimicrobium amorphum TaxID=2596890 RepID=A0A5S9IN45_UABAM|nr:methyltransferase domain-containing protein [Candidatus Uabimicrobium amorphum]BBM83605.1 SAM-dependent methyltransferase [Candidatus Uabimicrobium amorphum]